MPITMQVKMLIKWVASKIQGRGLGQKYKFGSHQYVMVTHSLRLDEITGR